jgi:sugar lactone lactonase YvrE
VVLPFTGLDRPVGVAVDYTGAVYVTDSQNNRVVKLAGNSYTQTVLAFTGLNNPQGVAVGREGLVFVTDANNDRVLWARAPQTPASPPWQAISSTEWMGPFSGLQAPHGVAADDYPHFWVVDGGNNRVLKWAAGANAPDVLPFTGLNNPDGMAWWNGDGSTFVVDTGNNRVLVQKGSNPSTPQTVLPLNGLNKPQGVAVTNGAVYVTDSGNNRVLKLTTDPNSPTGFSATPTILPFAGLNNPDGVAVDNQGNLYVVDSGNNRVLKLDKAFTTQ